MFILDFAETFGIRFFLFLDSELSQPRTSICFEKVPFAPGPLLFSLIEQLSQYFLRFVFCFSTTGCAFRLYFVPSQHAVVKFPKFVIPQCLTHVHDPTQFWLRFKAGYVESGLYRFWMETVVKHDFLRFQSIAQVIATERTHPTPK